MSTMTMCPHYQRTVESRLTSSASIECDRLLEPICFKLDDPDGRDQIRLCTSYGGKGCKYIDREVKNMDDNQITLTPTPTASAEGTELSAKQIEAVTLHRKIMTDGQIAADSMLALAQDLKQMRDTKLYKELGHDSFESYCEESAHIKQRQAYNFISALDKFGADGLQAHASLGITKLAALATLCDSDRDQLMQSEDVAELTTRELQAKIDDLQHKYDQLTLDNDELAGTADKAAARLSQLDSDKSALMAQIESLTGKIKELESEPKEVITDMSEEEADKIRAAALAEATAEKEKAIDICIKAAADKAKRDIEALKSVKESADKARSAAEAAKLAAEERAKALEAQLANLQATAKKAEAAPPPSSSKDILKYHFTEIQTAFNVSAEIIGTLDGDERDKYKAAMLKLADACRVSIEQI